MWRVWGLPVVCVYRGGEIHPVAVWPPARRPVRQAGQLAAIQRAGYRAWDQREQERR